MLRLKTLEWQRVAVQFERARNTPPKTTHPNKQFAQTVYPNSCCVPPWERKGKREDGFARTAPKIVYTNSFYWGGQFWGLDFLPLKFSCFARPFLCTLVAWFARIGNSSDSRQSAWRAIEKGFSKDCEWFVRIDSRESRCESPVPLSSAQCLLRSFNAPLVDMDEVLEEVLQTTRRAPLPAEWLLRVLLSPRPWIPWLAKCLQTDLNCFRITLSFLSLFFFEIPCFFSLRGFPCFFKRFSLLFQGF